MTIYPSCYEADLPVQPSIGLVLAGGGAKGAYQAGALKYLAEIGFQPRIIAGTSIGALNGAVLASNSSFPRGVDLLNQLWDELGKAQILKPNAGAAITILSYVTLTAVPNFQGWAVKLLERTGLIPDGNTIFDPRPIEQLMRKAIDVRELRRGRELWITVFPSLNIPGFDYDLLMVGMDIIRAKLGTEAHWLCAGDFDDDDVLYDLLLASAAIPLAFPQRQVNGQHYIDGGLADNIPFGALAARGCTHAIVIHLDNGEIWNRQDFPGQAIIEIRPEQQLNSSGVPIWGSVSSVLNFTPQYVSDLKRRGYQDAKRCLEPILQTFGLLREQRQSHQSLLESTRALIEDPPL
ncbi:MAG: hypothetical protein N5P05_000596 [Chroococcopsis gigantea SAG 12.99]|jgi:NTE family protein|nr:patatin-like phospholipase family protein [Chlorogloea purpurea SAG 13.99]MDV2998990.1 hypothetical protein [Chroococcopsis gigantea SAG 12.99]